VELMSLFPTVTDVLGLKAPQSLQGVSIRPLMENPDAAWTRGAYTVVARGGGKLGRCVHTERFRYVEWDEGRDGAELYDHNSDPHEYRNLVQEPKYKEVVRELQARLREMRKMAG
jgi:uncharacterized sulfatase